MNREHRPYPHPDEPMAEDPTIAVVGLSYCYPGRTVPAVQDMSFEVAQGEVFGFLGPSGAGKTTTQRALLGLVEGWTGTIQLLGRERRSWGPELYDRIGVGFELPAGYPRLTAREDLRHFANLHRRPSRDIDQLLLSVGLDDVGDELVGSYSKGMRIRLNLARAILHQPELLFLDEPTSGLDPVNAARVRDVVRAERDRGATVFLTTHDMHTADELCDRVAFVVDGRIETCDNPRDLRLAYGQQEVRVERRTGEGTMTESFALHPLSERLLSLLSSGEVETIHTAEATLDDVFVAVTGRDL